MSYISFQEIKNQLKIACDAARKSDLRKELNSDTVHFSARILPAELHEICTHHANGSTQKLEKAGRSKIYSASRTKKNQLLASAHFQRICSLMKDDVSTNAIKQSLKDRWREFLVPPYASDIPDDFKCQICRVVSDTHETLDAKEQAKLKSLKGSDFWEWLTCVTLIALSQPEADDRLRKSWILAQPSEPVASDPLYELLKKGEAEYHARQGMEAVRTLTAYLNNSNVNCRDEARYYLGKAYLLHDSLDYAKAEEMLSKVTNGEFAGDAYYLRYKLCKDGCLYQGAKKDIAAMQKRLLEQADDKGSLDAKLERAEYYFKRADKPGHISGSSNLQEAIRRYEKIIELEHKAGNFAHTPFAAYRLCLCAAYPGSGIGDRKANEYLRIAADGGISEAMEKQRLKSPMELLSVPQPAPKQSAGCCVFNAVNSKALYLAMTLPVGWEKLCLCQEEASALHQRMKKAGCKFIGAQAPEELTNFEKKQFFMLVSDNFKKNQLDALYLLQAITEAKAAHMTGDGQKIEVYLRGDCEYCAPLVDTMVNLMGKYAIPVHILDDDSDSVLSLLAELPLFFPIRNLSECDEVSLHFIVLGANRCAEFLVRHAFWLMNFHNKKITTKITVLAPEAKRLEHILQGKYPGMFDKSIVKCWLQCPELHFEPISYDGPELNEWLDLHASDHCYFTVAGDSEEDNLALAIRLREWTVRKKLVAAQETVIAFQCPGAENAFLSRQLVVQSQPYGTPWYSNYCLRAFASDSRYDWKNLTCHPLEMMSRCIHMGYYGVEPDADVKEKASALESYFNRYYNHASSYAVAVGLVYRLFSCWHFGFPCLPQELRTGTQEAMEQLYQPEILEKMAKQFEEHLSQLNSIDQLAHQEHDRWVAYMLASGWTAASREMMTQYLATTQNHQLYAGRIHPCICPYEEIDQVAKERYEKLKSVNPEAKYNNLKDYDLMNIKFTAQFLRRSWSPAAL